MGKTKSTNGYCDSCGTRVDWKSGWCPNTACATNTEDWEHKAMEPGPVRLPTREEAMADSRRLRWQPIDTLPTDRATLITRDSAAGWLVERHHHCPPNPRRPYVYGQPATHWAEDSIGHP